MQLHFPPRFQRSDQLVDHLPGREPWVGDRIPIVRQFVGFEQAHLAALRGKNARFDHAADAGVFGLGECLGHIKLPFGKPLLLEPGDSPTRVGVEITLLLGQNFVERLVDKSERFAD
jgi:hypothetical protein